MKNIVVLSLSGGMDSTSLLLHFLAKGFEVKTLSFDYGQKHKVELVKVQAQIEYLKNKGYIVENTVVDLSVLGSLYNSALTSSDIAVPEGFYAEGTMRSTVVPNRNAIFSSIIYGYALSLAEKHKTKVLISLGIHAGDHAVYPDCSQEFRDALDYAFKIGNWGSENVEYVIPYINIDKSGILKDLEESCETINSKNYIEDHINFINILQNTNTCYNPNEKGEACGKCGSCIERILAFNEFGGSDFVKYTKPWNEVLEEAKKLQQNWCEK